MSQFHDTTDICTTRIVSATKNHTTWKLFKKYHGHPSRSMDTEHLWWNWLRETYVWITRRCFDWWISMVYSQRYGERTPTKVLWRKHKNTEQHIIYWIVNFMVSHHSRSSEQISPMYDSNENGSIALLCEIWSQLRYFLLVLRIISAWTLFISPSQDWENGIRKMNSNEHSCILTNDFTTHIPTSSHNSKNLVVCNRCHANETVLIMHQLNPSLVIWRMKSIFLCVNLYKMLKKQ